MCQEIHFCSVTTSKTSFTTLGHLTLGLKSRDIKSSQLGTKMTPMTRFVRSYSDMIRIGSQKLQLSQMQMRCHSIPKLPSWGFPLTMRCLSELIWLKMSTQTILLYLWKRFKNLPSKRESKYSWAWTPLRSSCMMKIPRPRLPCRSWPNPGLRPHKIRWPRLTERRCHGGSQRWRTGSNSSLTLQSSLSKIGRTTLTKTYLSLRTSKKTLAILVVNNPMHRGTRYKDLPP